MCFLIRKSIKRFLSWRVTSWNIKVSWNLRNFSGSVSRNIRIVFFWEIMRNFLGVSIPWSIRNFLGVDFFFFLAGKMASWNIRRFFRVSISWNIRYLLLLEPESSISWKYDNFFSAFFSVFGVRRVTSWNIREI